MILQISGNICPTMVVQTQRFKKCMCNASRYIIRYFSTLYIWLQGYDYFLSGQSLVCQQLSLPLQRDSHLCASSCHFHSSKTVSCLPALKSPVYFGEQTMPSRICSVVWTITSANSGRPGEVSSDTADAALDHTGNCTIVAQ